MCLKPITPHDTWFVYFIFAPDGNLTASHRFALSRLRDMACGVLVVCATAKPENVPGELQGFADALYWKALSGYDFSAYTLALWALSEASPHSDVCVLNDSVFGPFYDLRRFVHKAPWEFAGFTALDATENHIQSYAFIVRNLHPERMAGMRTVFHPRVVLNRATDVILCQETRFARVASRSMSTGAYWYTQEAVCLDPTLAKPFELIDLGFPFLKKSLLGRMSGFQPREAVLESLRRVGHPSVE